MHWVWNWVSGCEERASAASGKAKKSAVAFFLLRPSEALNAGRLVSIRATAIGSIGHEHET